VAPTSPKQRETGTIVTTVPRQTMCTSTCTLRSDLPSPFTTYVCITITSLHSDERPRMHYISCDFQGIFGGNYTPGHFLRDGRPQHGSTQGLYPWCYDEKCAQLGYTEQKAGVSAVVVRRKTSFDRQVGLRQRCISAAVAAAAAAAAAANGDDVLHDSALIIVMAFS